MFFNENLSIYYKQRGLDLSQHNFDLDFWSRQFKNWLNSQEILDNLKTDNWTAEMPLSLDSHHDLDLDSYLDSLKTDI